MSSRHERRMTIPVDCEGNTPAIIATPNGEPIVLLVPEETLELFNDVKTKLNLSHIDLANRLMNSVCVGGGQFHKNSVLPLLQELSYTDISDLNNLILFALGTGPMRTTDLVRTWGGLFKDDEVKGALWALVEQDKVIWQPDGRVALK